MKTNRLALSVLCAAAVTAMGSENVQLGGSLDNCRLRFERQQTGHVAFIGGSITEMNGYRPMVCGILEQRFPKTKFEFTAAGISSTCSTTGAMRLHADVLSKGPVDLFFIEFAVNDDQDAGHARRECIRGLEGLIQQCLRHNPKMDIVVTYFVNPGMRDQLQAGRIPLSIGAHTEVTDHYGISTIHLAREVAERINAKTLTWATFGGTHPKPAGNRICADLIDRLFTMAWKEPLDEAAVSIPHRTPEKPLDTGSYGNGRFISPEKVERKSGWTWSVPAWKSIPGGKRGRFTRIPMLHAGKPDAELTLKFDGRAVGAYVVAGPDAGLLEASIDNGPYGRHDLYHRFSRGLHYPRTVMFASDLKPGPHTLRLRISAEKIQSDRGTAARILQFVAN
ncbi:MAG: SGNH/GDSL hydrolase family protein [Planctomycetaceae bacterium]